MAVNNEVLVLILGGGRGTRLFPLTQHRSKPAVPIGGATTPTTTSSSPGITCTGWTTPSSSTRTPIATRTSRSQLRSTAPHLHASPLSAGIAAERLLRPPRHRR